MTPFHFRRMLLVAAALSTATVVAEAADRPNMVVLYSDDAGYADFGFQPHAAADMKGLTPHIDSIAAAGARFSDAYMSGAVCSPSRAGLMTGRYQQRFGFDNNLPPGTRGGLDLGETLIAERLRTLGYRTGLIGKWHLGYPTAYHPNERGFDLFHGLMQGSRPYLPMPRPTPHRVIQRNGEPQPEEGYVTDRLGDAACRFLTDAAAGGRAGEGQPFFLFVSFTAPHGPLQPRPGNDRRLARFTDVKRKRYAGLTVALDDNVGHILRTLDELGLAGDTLVLFTNDNGGQTTTGAVNSPLRGRKGDLFEGGVRVPWAVRWPGRAPAGSVVSEPVIALDLLPTCLELAGGTVDPEWKLDGRSFLPALTGDEAGPTRPLFWRTHGPTGRRAMREGRWKLVHLRPDPPLLFDLTTDLSESTDLAADQSDRVAAMTAALDAWEAELEPPRWGPGAAADR